MSSENENPNVAIIGSDEGAVAKEHAIRKAISTNEVRSLIAIATVLGGPMMSRELDSIISGSPNEVVSQESENENV